MNRFFYFLSAFLVSLIIMGCQSVRPDTAGGEGVKNPTPTALPKELVEFDSNFMAKYIGMTISFQYPRAWQVGYFSDSGDIGWVISDIDPNKAFWQDGTTGEEIIAIITFSDQPASEALEFSNLPDEAKQVEFENNGKKVQYITMPRVLQGVITDDQFTFLVMGHSSEEKDPLLQEGLQTILSSFEWTETSDINIDQNRLLGTRHEGVIQIGDMVDGYVPSFSISEWTFEGLSNQELHLTINTHQSGINLSLDVLDNNQVSILPSGENEFTTSVNIENVKIPENGIYTIQVQTPKSVRGDGSDVYGWYQISLE